MSKSKLPPLPTPSLSQIQDSAKREVRHLEATIARHPKWAWPHKLLVFAQEFEVLAFQSPRKVEQLREFHLRQKDHILTAELKGLEHVIWNAQTLVDIATKEARTGIPPETTTATDAVSST